MTAGLETDSNKHGAVTKQELMEAAGFFNSQSFWNGRSQH
jgi:hypothetical protein